MKKKKKKNICLPTRPTTERAKTQTNTMRKIHDVYLLDTRKSDYSISKEFI